MISQFQQDVSRVFFELPASASFALAGGAALIARDLVHRQTYDIDLFTDNHSDAIQNATAEFLAAAKKSGWSVEIIQQDRTFTRLSVAADDESVLVDLAVDSPPVGPVSATGLGPTLHSHDLAARKILALFGRAEARDFTDVYELARQFGCDRLLSWAGDQDPGFDRGVFASMLGTIARFDDKDLGRSETAPAELRAFFRGWASDLRATRES